MADSSDRVAELKRKMQEAAAKRMAEQAEKENAALSAAGLSDAAPTQEAPAAAEVAQAAEQVVEKTAEVVAESTVSVDAATSGVQPVADAIAELEEKAAVADSAVEAAPAAAAAEPAEAAMPAVAAPGQNGASADTSEPEIPRELTPEEIEQREYSRRELLTYAWGGALALVGGAVGLGLFGFMYPRFRAGEFGGEFFVSSAELPATSSAPVGFSSGKFWLVQSETEGAKALYMVCTHLGCLYKWEESNFRFECPCHGSKFSKDGYYIEGPAPRSLDTFATTVDGDTIIVDTGAKTLGASSLESPARAASA